MVTKQEEIKPKEERGNTKGKKKKNSQRGKGKNRKKKKEACEIPVRNASVIFMTELIRHSLDIESEEGKESDLCMH